MEYISLIPLLLLGILFGLDTVSFPQIMISRPVCSATLAGVLLGNPIAGLSAGVIMEIMALDTLPFGASRYPDWGTAGVVAGAVAALTSDRLTWPLMLIVIGAGLATASFSSWSMVLGRYANVNVLKANRDGLQAGDVNTVSKVHRIGVAFDAFRAAIVTFISLVVLLPLSRYLLSHWGAAPQLSAQFGVTVIAAIGLAAVWKLFRATRNAVYMFGIGLLAGLGVIYLS